MLLLSLLFLACGDKQDDTGSVEDTAVQSDTAAEVQDTAEQEDTAEAIEGEDTASEDTGE